MCPRHAQESRNLTPPINDGSPQFYFSTTCLQKSTAGPMVCRGESLLTAKSEDDDDPEHWIDATLSLGLWVVSWTPAHRVDQITAERSLSV